MKTLVILAVVILMIFPLSPPVVAQEAEKQSGGAMMQMGSAHSKGKTDMMMQNMHKMRKQMEKIHGTNDPDKRKQLMNEHMQSMQENMMMMRGMGGGMMMGVDAGKKGGAMMSKDTGSYEKGQRHQMMEQRMDMMQMMMEQMMEQMMAEKGMVPMKSQ